MCMLSLYMPLLGCQSPQQQGGRVSTRATEIYWHDQLVVRTGIEIGLSDASIDALHSGVPLTFTVDLRLGKRYGFWAREINTRSYHWTIRYLPLSEHYALEDPNSGLTIDFPRLRTLLTGIRLPTAYATGIQTETIDSSNYQMQIRCRLNRLRLPAPLRLPALFSSDWQLSENWQTHIIPLPPNGTG